MGGNCPDIAQLERFVLEQAENEERSTITEHLGICPACADEVVEIRENLRLASSLRHHPGPDGPLLTDADPPEFEFTTAAPDTVGPYRILRQLGQGGMGAVYLAEQENPRRVVALKMVRPGLVSRALLARFRNEAQALARLRHPGIAQIYDAGTHFTPDGATQPYFVMEAVGGLPLLEYAQKRDCPQEDRLELLARICDAVQHAHQRGVIHRDLKPDNILVEESAADAPQPKILDFGVSRVIDPDAQTTTLHTSAGQIVGTVAYMSPEQATGQPDQIDTRSDVYALGVIGYQLLCGKLPYNISPASIAESVRAIVQDDPTPLSSIDRALRGDVTTIIGKALSKEKSRRYASAAEMAADIRRHLRDEPIAAHPPSTLYQLGKFARRNKGLVSGVASAFVLLIAGVIGTSVGLVRAERSAARAQLQADRQTAVNAFLQELLSAADARRANVANQARGRDVTVFQALEAASAKVEQGSLADQPAVEFAVRLTMANTYLELGEYDPADRHARRAVELAGQLHGPVSHDLADATNTLAYLRRCQGRLNEAEALGREALDLTARTYGPEHRNTTVVMNSMALILQELGRHAEAEQFLRRTLELRERTLGHQHEDVATALNNLAQLLDDHTHGEEIERLLRRALAIRETNLGPLHPNVAIVLNNLGFSLRARGNLGDAETAFRRSLQIRRQTLGDDHPDTANASNNLGSLLQAMGRIDEAQPLYEEAIRIQREAYGPAHPALAASINNLASLIRDRGDFASAEPLFREALSIRRQTLPPGHPALAVGMSNLSTVLRETGQLEEAETLSRQAVALASARFGPNHLDTAAHRMHLGACLRLAGKFEQAERELLDAYDTIKSKFPNDRRVGFITANLHKLYVAWEKPEQAERYAAMLPTTFPSTPTPATASDGDRR